MANQALTVSPQPAVTVEGPVSKMSPPTNDVTNGVVAPAATLAPRVPTNPSLTTVNPLTHKRTPKDFIFGKVIGEGSFSTVSTFLFFSFVSPSFSSFSLLLGIAVSLSERGGKVYTYIYIYI